MSSTWMINGQRVNKDRLLIDAWDLFTIAVMQGERRVNPNVQENMSTHQHSCGWLLVALALTLLSM